MLNNGYVTCRLEEEDEEEEEEGPEAEGNNAHTEGNNTHAEQQNGGTPLDVWVPVALGLGLPLSPDKLCIAVCGRAGASNFLEVLLLCWGVERVFFCPSSSMIRFLFSRKAAMVHASGLQMVMIPDLAGPHLSCITLFSLSQSYIGQRTSHMSIKQSLAPSVQSRSISRT